MAISSIKSITEQYKEITGTETTKAADAAVRTVLNLFSETLLRDGVLSLPGFGTFTVKESPARTGRNPQTGEALDIAASKRVGFKPSSVLKTLVRGE